MSFNGIIGSTELARSTEEKINCIYCPERFEPILIALGQKDRYTGIHSKSVGFLVELLAINLGLSEDEIKDITLAARLHDIGKIGVKDVVLQKPGKLTNEEFELMKAHAQKSIPYVRKIPIPTLVPNILHHHEKWNGSGYPEKLSGETIPLGARIISLANSWDSMTSERGYQDTCSTKDALIEVQDCSGSHFDPYLVKHFLNIYPEKLESMKRSNYIDI